MIRVRILVLFNKVTLRYISVSVVYEDTTDTFVASLLAEAITPRSLHSSSADCVIIDSVCIRDIT